LIGLTMISPNHASHLWQNSETQILSLVFLFNMSSEFDNWYGHIADPLLKCLLIDLLSSLWNGWVQYIIWKLIPHILKYLK